MKLITVDEIKAIIEKKEDIILLNALDKTGFDKGHIPGSINVPIDDIFEGEIKDKRKKIVVYCSGGDSKISKIAAEKLENLGFNNVYIFEGGIVDWKKAGFHLEQ